MNEAAAITQLRCFRPVSTNRQYIDRLGAGCGHLIPRKCPLEISNGGRRNFLRRPAPHSSSSLHNLQPKSRAVSPASSASRFGASPRGRLHRSALCSAYCPPLPPSASAFAREAIHGPSVLTGFASDRWGVPTSFPVVALDKADPRLGVQLSD